VIPPFLPALAPALTIIAHEVEKAIRRVVANRNAASALTVAGVALTIVGPVAFIAHSLATNATSIDRIEY
jgi:hypothetical protein